MTFAIAAAILAAIVALIYRAGGKSVAAQDAAANAQKEAADAQQVSTYEAGVARAEAAGRVEAERVAAESGPALIADLERLRDPFAGDPPHPPAAAS